MAMSKEDQKAASERILKKFPLTEEERRILALRSMNPDEYPSHATKRVCVECGAEFRDIKNQKGEMQVTMLEQFAEHSAMHNPSPAQWSEAYLKIQEAKPARE